MKKTEKPPVELSLEDKVGEIISRLEQLIEEHEIINPEPFRKIIEALSIQVSDVVAVENSMNSIRREITEPVKIEIEKSAKLGKFSLWGFLVGIVGGLLAIISIALSLYWNFKNTESFNSFMSNTEKLVSSQKANNDELSSIIKNWDKKRLAKIEAELERLDEEMKSGLGAYSTFPSGVEIPSGIDFDSLPKVDLETMDLLKDFSINPPVTIDDKLLLPTDSKKAD